MPSFVYTKIVYFSLHDDFLQFDCSKVIKVENLFNSNGMKQKVQDSVRCCRKVIKLFQVVSDR